MTNREFYTAIVNANINDEITAHASEAIAKLDAALEARKNKPSKKTTENAPVLEALTGILTAEPQVASDIATAAGISTQKASALLRQLVATGVAVQSEVKVPKKGTVKAYALATVEA
jgi:hypothetical protein